MIVLGGWAVNNGVRYDDYAVARGGAAYLPFFRVLTTDHLVEPANGSASRELARAVEREVLTRAVSLARDRRRHVLRAGERPHVRGRRERVGHRLGLGQRLRAAPEVALEAVREQPGAFTKGSRRRSGSSSGGRLLRAARPPGGHRHSTAGAAPPGGTAATPAPASDGELIPAASRGLYITTPDRSIDEVWRPSGEHRVVFADPSDGKQFDAMLEELRAVESRVPAYEGNAELVHQLSRSSRLWPPAIAWLAIGVVAVLLRRPRRALDVVAAAIAGALVLLANGASVRGRRARDARDPGLRGARGRRAPGRAQDRLATVPRR